MNFLLFYKFTVYHQQPIHIQRNRAMEVVLKKDVFEMGKLKVQEIPKEKKCSDPSSPPKPLLIITPSEAGKYPVVLFLHGFFLSNNYYSQLLKHISSHGFILVAPQLYCLIPKSSKEDIASAAAVTDWLAGNLQALLPTGVEANLEELALAGHSRGGHAAFSLPLGHAHTTLKFSALIGVDPVAGVSKGSQTPPNILTYEPSSFQLGIPVMVIGTGLGEQKKYCFAPACAPEGVNHAEFYYECQPPCYHIVVKDYGHLDMLNDDAPWLTKCMCTNGVNCRDLMRRSTGGIMVAFLEAYMMNNKTSLKCIVNDPHVAPAALSHVEYRLK